ncbi:hypothetical protein F5X96DRAFT_684044 [Biscogniauxia mediterranea]|nr:hypothetical protein F5X96DRAFT_684044 [Biscogniauxia mediterranea]
MEPTKKQNTILGGDIDDSSSASDDDLVFVLSRVKVKHPTNISLAPIPDEVKKFKLPDKMGNNKRMANTRPITTKNVHHSAAKPEPATHTNPHKKRKITSEYRSKAQPISHLRFNTQAKDLTAGVKKPRSGQIVLSREERQNVRKHPETYNKSKHVNEGDKQRNAADSRSPRGSESTGKPASIDHRADNNDRKLCYKPRQDNEREGGNRGGGQRPGQERRRGTRGSGKGEDGAAVIAPARGPENPDPTLVDPLYKWKYTLHCLDDVRDLDFDDPHSRELGAAARARATQLPESYVERVAANRRLDALTAEDKFAVVRRATALDTPLRLLRVDLALASGRRMRLWVDRQLVDLRRDIKTKKERELKKWSGTRPRLPHYVVECGFLIYESVMGGGGEDEGEGGEGEEEEDARAGIRVRLPEQQHQDEMDVDTDTDVEDADPLPLAQQQASGKEPDSSSSSPSARDERRRQQHQQRLDRIADHSSSSSQHPPHPHPCPSSSSSSYPMSTSACPEIRIHAQHLPLTTFTERGLANAHASGVFLAHSRVARPLRNALDDFWWERHAAAGADREAWRRVTAAEEEGGKGKMNENSGEEGEDRGGGDGEGDGEDGEEGEKGLYDALLETGAMRARLGYDRLYVRVHAVADVQGPLNI